MTESGQNKKNENQILKCLTLTNSVVFPHIIFPVVIDVPSLKKLISDAEKGDKIVSVFPESIPDHAEPDTEPEIFSVGVRCRILKHFTTDGGETRVIFHAMERIRLNSFIKTQKTYRLAD